ncbi:MAG: hypothetical protein LIO46_00785 [Clostridiales bacterium]|nr:hypothetical protein [Clostridiales bacterium]
MAEEGAEGALCADGGYTGGVSADAQSPNNLWWLYRGYAEMAGEVTLVQNSKSTGGLAHSDSSINAVEVLLSGSVGDHVLKLQSLDQTVLSGADLVRVTVEYVYDTGANAILADPVTKVVYTASVSGGSLTLTLDGLRQDAVYRVTVQPTSTALEAEENEQPPVRYRPASADGRVQISDSTARFTEETEDGTGAVSFQVSVPENGSYQMELQYGYLTPSESAVPLRVLVDGEYELGLELEPSEQDGFRSSVSFQLELEKGTRTIKLEEADAAQAAQPVLFCLDSTFLCGQMEALPDALYEAIDAWERMTDDNNAFLLSVPEDGYYTLYLDYEFEEQNNVVYRIDGTATGVVETVSDDYHSDVVYLARGLHYIELDGAGAYDIYTVSAQPAQDPGDTEELDLSQVQMLGAAAVSNGVLYLSHTRENSGGHRKPIRVLGG